MTPSFCQQLRGEADEIWRTLKEHPFVQELAAGTLPPEKFRFYIEQNLLYLPEYGRAIAIGASKARDLDELHQFAAALTNIVENEIPTNRALRDRISELGDEEPQPAGTPVVMAPANVAYTSYLVATAYCGGPLEVMTALMPCAWSYGDIATSLAEVADHPVYAEWVEFFRSARYEDLVGEMRGQLDSMAIDVSAAEHRRLAEIFRTCARLEWGFWEMGYTLAQWPDVRLAAATAP
jgi:thiaminase/transcriptional activator TenA